MVTISISDEVKEYSEIIEDNIFYQDEVEESEDGTKVIIGGEITRVEKKKTKTGQDFANLTVEYEANEWKVKVWKNKLVQYREIIEEGAIVMVNGSRSEWNGFVSIVADQIILLKDLVLLEDE